MTIKDATNMVSYSLDAIGESSRAEAEWIVALTLNIKRSQTNSNDLLTKNQEEAIFKIVKKREKGIPIQYIFSSAGFYGNEFYVNKHVLIPRPETEYLVETALADIKDTDTVLDLGTGCGCIGLTIAKQSKAKVVVTDISSRILRVAKRNAKELKVNVKFIKSDVFKNLEGYKFDKIISNPPYIADEEYEKLDMLVKNNEPKVALVGGVDGLLFYKQIINEAPKYLNDGGKVYFEIGYAQADSVCKLLEKDFCDIKVDKDLDGHDRIITAKLKER